MDLTQKVSCISTTWTWITSCLNRPWQSPIPLKNTASLLHKLQDLVLYLVNRDQYTLPSSGSSLSHPILSKYIFSFSFYLFIFLHLYSLSSLISLFNEHYHFQIHFFRSVLLTSFSSHWSTSLHSHLQSPFVRKFHIPPTPTFISTVFLL